jgi:hypothetical protein
VKRVRTGQVKLEAEWRGRRWSRLRRAIRSGDEASRGPIEPPPAPVPEGAEAVLLGSNTGGAQ